MNRTIGAPIARLAGKLAGVVLLTSMVGSMAFAQEKSLQIDANGNVGIGTSTPQCRLHVAGKVMAETLVLREADGSEVQLRAEAADPHEQPKGKKVRTLRMNARPFDETGWVMPVGTIVAYGGREVPKGWLRCSGELIPRGTPYDMLREVLGRDSLPDLRGRFVLGGGATGANDLKARDMHQRGGEEMHKLTIDEIPAHNHALSYPDEMSEKQGWPRTGFKSVYASDRVKSSGASAMANTGNGMAHNNMPPYYVLTYIIKY